MNQINEHSDPEDELYANAFLHFLRELKLLAEEAEVQCVTKQYDNVAWELKNFFIGLAEAVLNHPGGNFSNKQRDGVRQLIEHVMAVPDEVVNVANTREQHRRAMRDPCWLPVRGYAKNLISLLDSETRRTEAILWPLE